eukprot:c10123_g1_i1.p1 GENE.c10123_g1_i1~~c10123_g1_i1.p1  ORF type:complete len:651 (+),score=111.25 c10123_g1_i1:13-1965(+)
MIRILHFVVGCLLAVFWDNDALSSVIYLLLMSLFFGTSLFCTTGLHSVAVRIAEIAYFSLIGFAYGTLFSWNNTLTHNSQVLSVSWALLPCCMLIDTQLTISRTLIPSIALMFVLLSRSNLTIALCTQQSLIVIALAVLWFAHKHYMHRSLIPFPQQNIIICFSSILSIILMSSFENSSRHLLRLSVLSVMGAVYGISFLFLLRDRPLHMRGCSFAIQYTIATVAVRIFSEDSKSVDSYLTIGVLILCSTYLPDSAFSLFWKFGRLFLVMFTVTVSLLQSRQSTLSTREDHFQTFGMQEINLSPSTSQSKVQEPASIPIDVACVILDLPPITDGEWDCHNGTILEHGSECHIRCSEGLQLTGISTLCVNGSVRVGYGSCLRCVPSIVPNCDSTENVRQVQPDVRVCTRTMVPEIVANVCPPPSNSKPKLAICVSGDIRSMATVPDVLDSFEKRVIQTAQDFGYHVDVFFYARYDSSIPSLPMTLTKLQGKRYTRAIVAEDVKVCVPVISELKRMCHYDSNDPYDIVPLSMFFHISRCHDLVLEYSNKSGIVYDLELRTRFDLKYFDDWPWSLTNGTAVYLPEGNDHYGGFNDQVAFGPAELMAVYTNAFYNLPVIWDIPTFHPENCVRQNLQRHNITVGRFPMYYEIVRG